MPSDGVADASRLASHLDPATTMKYAHSSHDPLADYLGGEGRLVPSRWG